MNSHCSERWIIVGDLTGSTEFQWRLWDIHKKSPQAFFDAAFDFARTVNTIIDDVKLDMGRRLPRVRLGNTMGDGFMLVGPDGHGFTHIAKEAGGIIDAASAIKTQLDNNLTDLHKRTSDVLRMNGVEGPELPDLKLKLTIHCGFMVTDPSEEPRIVRTSSSIKRFIATQRYIGDSINYCYRISSAAFGKDYHHGIVVTEIFGNLQPLPSDYVRESIKVTNYPRRGSAEDATVFRYKLATRTN